MLGLELAKTSYGDSYCHEIRTDIITSIKEGDSKMPVLLPYLIGIVTAPLAAKIIKPVFRGVVKTTVGVAMEVKRVAAEAGEEIQDIAAEVSVEKVAADKAARAPKSEVVTTKETPRSGVVTTKETSTGVVSSRGT